jgi:hypothetical protein
VGEKFVEEVDMAVWVVSLFDTVVIFVDQDIRQVKVEVICLCRLLYIPVSDLHSSCDLVGPAGKS